MIFYRSKIKVLVTIVVAFLPFIASATVDSHATEQAKPPKEGEPKQIESNQADSFQSICLSSWMKRVGNIENKEQYKSFGEKYCSCALTQPLDTDAAVDKAIQVCMSRTLLRSTMDALKAEISLNKANENDVNRFCQHTWNLIYPRMSDQAKQVADRFCECSQPKLTDLIKKSSTISDKEFDTQINSVAAICSGPTHAPVTQEPSKQAE